MYNRKYVSTIVLSKMHAYIHAFYILELEVNAQPIILPTNNNCCNDIFKIYKW